jgi:signal transduction histidine kinase
MKIQYRIALIFAFLTICIVLGVGVTAYYFANKNTFEDFYKRLEIRAVVAAKTEFEQKEVGRNYYEELRKQHLEKLPYEQEITLSADSLQRDIARNKLHLPDAFWEEAMRRGKARYRQRDMFYLAFLYNEGSQKQLVVIGAKNEFIDAYLNNLFRIIFISIVCTVVIAALIGLWFSQLILRPIRFITQKMHHINASQLHLRLPPRKGNDELAELSGTFNNMLDRLEATFETQKNFISNASHELNTPLTAIIGESEYTLSKSRTEPEYVQSLTIILSEAERLKRITNSLLQLAQTGYNGRTQEFDTLRLDEILYRVKDTVDNIIPDNKVFINLNLMPEDETKLLINGNQQLLELALVNIVSNGCKYSRNAPVQVSIAATQRKIMVIVEDQGIGIPSNEIAYIYEPFFRASNTIRFNGYGIGLPLARNIIRMHNGSLEVTSEEAIGTKIKITLPLAYTEPA